MHSFTGEIIHPGADGAYPEAGLTLVDGILYGTAPNGGGYGCKHAGCCSVYRINPDGTGHKQIYAFKNGKDGVGPKGTLFGLGGTLYGTTGFGGTYGGDTIFKMTKDGHETVLHSFGENGTAPIFPFGGLIYFNKLLYGTASRGGNNDEGVIFSIDINGGDFKIRHFFGGPTDGQEPEGNLTHFGPTKIFGVAPLGGQKDNGIVYSLDADGKYEIVERFSGQPGPSRPRGSLTRTGQSFYGTSVLGGKCGGGGCGTAFILTP